MAVSRADNIVQSVQDLIRDQLFGDPYNYPTGKVELVDGFNGQLFDEKYGDTGLDKTYVAAAYQFDDGGRAAELGSSLTNYLHTIDFLVLGWTPTWGRNVAHVVKAIVSTDDGLIPLKDYGVKPPVVIDRLEIEEVSTQREFNLDPRPWNAYAWTTRLRLHDIVFAV